MKAKLVQNIKAKKKKKKNRKTRRENPFLRCASHTFLVKRSSSRMNRIVTLPGRTLILSRNLMSVTLFSTPSRAPPMMISTQRKSLSLRYRFVFMRINDFQKQQLSTSSVVDNDRPALLNLDICSVEKVPVTEIAVIIEV